MSGAQAKRLIRAGAVKIDGQKVLDPYEILPPREKPYLFQIGKRRFFKVRLHAT